MKESSFSLSIGIKSYENEAHSNSDTFALNPVDKKKITSIQKPNKYKISKHDIISYQTKNKLIMK